MGSCVHLSPFFFSSTENEHNISGLAGKKIVLRESFSEKIDAKTCCCNFYENLNFGVKFFSNLEVRADEKVKLLSIAKYTNMNK